MTTKERFAAFDDCLITSQYLANHCNITLKTQTSSSYQYADTLVYGFIERLRDSSTALNLLFEHAKTTQAMEHGIYIVLRATMLDLLFAQYIYCESEKDNGAGADYTKTDTLAQVILADGYRHIISYLEELKKVRPQDSERISATYNSLVKDRTDFFPGYTFQGEKPNVLPKGQVLTKGVMLFSYLIETHPFNGDYSAYDLYAYFSKYDHGSLLSLELMRGSEDVKIGMIQKAVTLMELHAYICHFLLDEYHKSEIQSYAAQLKAITGFCKKRRGGEII